jgi:Notch-like protein
LILKITILENLCDSIKCLNNGVCNNLNGTCLCLNGYYGDTCEFYNHCWINKCLNNGICIQTEDYFKCECNNGYNGSLCQNCKYILILA